MPVLNLFIDTNILLNFYAFSADQTEVLDELISFIGPQGIVLHLPRQVRNEFERNRESKLQQAVADLKSCKFPPIPNLMRDTEAAEQYRKAKTDAEKALKSLIANATGLALQFDLPIDKKLGVLFDKATTYDDEGFIYERAFARTQKGDPPGKNDQLGDRYNWEVLLEHAPEQDMYIVSEDGDFASPLTDSNKPSIRPKRFLSEEWSRLKGGKSLHIYTTVKSILAHYNNLVNQATLTDAPPPPTVIQPPSISPPEIPLPVVKPVPPPFPLPPLQTPPSSSAAPVPTLPQLTTEQLQAKQSAIEYLVGSGSFTTTHYAVSKLSALKGLLDAEDAEVLFRAALDNSQISWIASDEDVHDFYVFLANHFLTAVDPSLASEVIDLLGLNGGSSAAV
nr:PIN domain-containing protein [Pseudomonas sp.]